MSDPVPAMVDQYKQWMIGATKPRELVLPKASFRDFPDRSYSLKNKVPKRFLQHEDQTWGINLGWTDDATGATGNKVARWFFTRNGKLDEPLRFGESIAIGNGEQPSFINFKHRTTGINLGFSDSPSYEWKILGGKIGDPVYTQQWLAIFNEKSEDGECLIYFDRSAGGDIGWPTSKTWGSQLGDKAYSIAKKRALKELGLE